jgi:hypothetical protein
VEPKRIGASLCLVTLMMVGCACTASSSATPTTSHRSTVHAHRTVPTTTTTTTTTDPSDAPTSVPAPVVPAPGWTASLTALPPAGGFSSLSCISDTFCVAAGGGTDGGGTAPTTGSGVALSWDGAVWSVPSVYLPAPANRTVTSPVLPVLTCTSGPLCVIVDGSDHVATGDGTTWSTPAALGPAPPLPANPSDPGAGHPGSRTAAVSCPTPSLCAVVDNTGHTYTKQNGSWLAAQTFGEPQASAPSAGPVSLYQSGRVGVSCPDPTSCTAVVGSSVLDWNGVTWSQEAAPWATSLAPGTAVPEAISCPTTSLCVIVNGDDIVVRGSNHTWTPRQLLDPGRQLDSISCPSTQFCIAADDRGGVMSWNGTTWSGPTPAIPTASEYPGVGISVSCPSAQFCMVMNGDGDYATYTGPEPTSTSP